MYILEDFNVRLQGRLPEHNSIGPYVQGKGPRYINTSEDSNRQFFVNFLRTTASRDVLSYKQPNLTKQVTYRDKHQPPVCWSQFLAEPIILLQFWDKIQELSLVGSSTEMEIASIIRAYITADPLLTPPEAAISSDPYRYQFLDKIVTRSKWMPSVCKAQAVHSTGFPSDHYLLEATIRVKLAAQPPKIQRDPLYSYKDLTKEQVKDFRMELRKQLQTGYSALPAPQDPASAKAIYTDGSGSQGRCSADTPAGWGFVVVDKQTGEHEHSVNGPVETDSRSIRYIGANVGSNNTAELSAIVEALLFQLASPTAPASITFYYAQQMGG